MEQNRLHDEKVVDAPLKQVFFVCQVNDATLSDEQHGRQPASTHLSNIERECSYLKKSYEILSDANWEASLLKQLENELPGSEFDPLKLEDLQQTMLQYRLNKRDSPNKEQNSNEQMMERYIKSDFWMSFPRTISTHCCRFYLPLNAQVLENISAMEYLARFCVLSRKHFHLLNKVFAKHRSLDGYIKFQTVSVALLDIFGKPLSDDCLSEVYDKAEFSDNVNVDFDIFKGLVVLTERFVCSSSKLREVFHIEDTKDKVEELDFNFLSNYLKDTQLQQPLFSLLQWIKTS